MTTEELLQQIIADLGANFREDEDVILEDILNDVIEDALLASNRDAKAAASSEARATQLKILSSNIKRAVKTIYLQRGVEDVRSNSESGLSNTYDVAMERMLADIIRQNKRVLK